MIHCFRSLFTERPMLASGLHASAWLDEWRVWCAAALLAMALATLASVAPVSATTFYVRTNGNDAHDGLTPQTAFATIRYAGQSLLNPGDRAIVGPGEYHEGNIAPRRGGAPGQPVAFIADTPGMMTGDPPGPVVVLPASDKPDETTGFIVFGKQHIRIDGFTVRGAIDAAIQVRAAPQTGVASGDVTVVNNVVNNGLNGIELTAIAPVVAAGNTVSDCAGPGIIVNGVPNQSTDAQVTTNTLLRNHYGLILSDVRGGLVEDNQLLENVTGIQVIGGDGVTLHANQLHGSRSSGIRLASTNNSRPPSNLTVSANVIDASGHRALGGSAADSLSIVDNTFSGSGYGGVNLQMNPGTPGTVLLDGNQFSNEGYAALITAPSVMFQHNSVVGHAVGFEAYAQRAVFVGNTIDASARTTRTSASELVMQENHLTGAAIGIVAQAQRVTILGNQIGTSRTLGMQLTELVEGEISGNQIDAGDTGISVVASLQSFGTLQVTQNIVHAGSGAGIKIGPRLASSRMNVVCTGNQVSGNASTGISIRTQGNIDANDNIVSNVGGTGIRLNGARDTSDTHALRNMITDTTGGIRVEGARTAELDDNDVRNSKDHGYFVAQSDAVVVARNHAAGTTRSGITVGADALLRGDCNYDGQVTSDEVARAFEILFGDLPPTECSAIESDRDAQITVAALQEVLINASLGGAAPQPPSTVDIHDNNVTDSGDVGVLAVAADQVTAATNVVQRSGSVGVSVTGRRFADVAVGMNTIEASGGDGILSAGAGTVEISGNVIQQSGESGVRVRDGESVVVVSNQVQQTNEAGIFATGDVALSVTDNQVGASASGGIAAEGLLAGSLSAVIEHNGITDVAGPGILFDSAALAAASDNTVHNTGLDAIAVRRSDVVRLSNNALDTAGASGLTVGTLLEPAGVDVVIEGNQVKTTQLTAVVLWLTGRLVLYANVVQDSAHEGAAIIETSPTTIIALVANRIGPSVTGGLSVERASRAYVFDNVIFSVSGGSAIEVSNSGHVEVSNNLTYAAYDDGIGLLHVTDGHVFSNTAYGNGRYGVVLSEATADILDNILDHNGAAGLAVLGNPAPGTLTRYNLNTGGYDGIQPAPTDLAADPLFVDPDGADNILGGAGSADDDFHLRDGTPASPAIDAGLATPEVLGISGSTAADGRRDTGLADLGYHYAASPRFP